MRVLLADGDVDQLECLQSWLWDCGHEAEIAADGMECCATLPEFLPDVVVLERDLLWGGGAGVRDLMREDPALAGIPVILVADGGFAPEDYESLSDPPIAGWLQKPFRPSDLLSQLATVRRGSPSVRMFRHEFV